MVLLFSHKNERGDIFDVDIDVDSDTESDWYQYGVIFVCFVCFGQRNQLFYYIK